MDPSPATDKIDVTPRRQLIALYVVVAFLYWMALYLYVPTLPVYVQSKTDDLAMVGVVLSMYGLWQAVIRLPLGITSDRVGRRKPFIVAGLVLVGLGAWLMGIAKGVNGLLVGRAVTGLAAGTWVPLVVVFSGLFSPADAVRATSMLTLVSSVSRMLATGVTGFLNASGGYSLAFFLATGAAAVAVLVVLTAREQRRPPMRPSVKSLSKLVTRKDVSLPAWLNAVVLYAVWASTFGFFPVLADQLGAADVTQSLLTSMNIAVVMLGNLLATALVKRMGARRMVILGFVLMSGGIGAAAAASSLSLVFVAQFCTGLAAGINIPVLMGMSIAHVIDAERASAMGLHQSIYALGMFTGPWLSGILADVMGIRPMFAATAVACLLLGVLGARLLDSARAGTG